MLTWSKPNAIVPDEPLRWILTTLRFYAIVASVGMALAFVGISILVLAPKVLHHKDIVNSIVRQIDRIEGGGGTLLILNAIISLFGAATYFTSRLYLYGKAEYITSAVGFVVALVGLLASVALGVLGLIVIVNPIEAGDINRIEGGGGTMVVLVAMILLFTAATYFTGRLYGTVGYIACAAGFVVVCFTLAFVGIFG